MERKSMGALIAALRKANGMTQKELAEKLNVSDKTVSRWERDDGTPELALIPVIAEIFGVTCDELLRGERRPAGEREKTDEPAVSQKSGKQRQRLLASSLSRYRARSAVSMGLAAAGLIAAMTCNFAFLRAYIGFAAAAVCALAAVVCQTAFVNSALLSVADEELAGAEVDRFKRTVVRLAEFAISLTVVLLAFSLPLLLTGDAYVGLAAETWLPAGLICAALALVLCAVVCYILNGIFQKKGMYSLPERETQIWLKNCLWQRRCAVGLLIALIVTLGLQTFVCNVWDTADLSPALEFTSVESFVEFMEREEYPTYYSESGTMVMPAPQDAAIWYDENGDEISEEEALTETLTDRDGNVICTYVRRNRMVARIQYSAAEELFLPIRVVTHDMLNVGRSRQSLISAGFAVLYCLEAAAAALVYLRKRENL